MNEKPYSSDAPPRLEPAPIVLAEDASWREHASTESHVVSICICWTVIWMIVAIHLKVGMGGPAHKRLEATLVDVAQVNVTAKMLVGLEFAKRFEGMEKVVEDQQEAFKGSEFTVDQFPEIHWGEAIILNEVRGPVEALQHMEIVQGSIDKLGVVLTSGQQRLHQILSRIFMDYERGDLSASSASEDDRKFLGERLGWVGTLALTPKSEDPSAEREAVERSAFQFMLVLVAFFVLVGLALVAGVIGLLLVFIGILVGRIQLRFSAPSGRGYIFVETFAIWFVAFTLLQVGIGLWVPSKWHLVAAGIASIGSFAFLSWPIIRGIPWSEVRRDIGWRRSHPVVEVCCGLMAYICLMPLVFVAFFLTAALAQFLSGTGLAFAAQLDGKDSPAHPIVFELMRNDPLTLISAIVLACVMAPIIEETMFRGVLYRHLRDSTIWFRRFVSVALSAGVNSVIFAAIHPQGLIGIPVLATLALGFSIVREWRDSLIAPVFMHALNNTTALTVFLLMMRSLSAAH